MQVGDEVPVQSYYDRSVFNDDVLVAPGPAPFVNMALYRAAVAPTRTKAPQGPTTSTTSTTAKFNLPNIAADKSMSLIRARSRDGNIRDAFAVGGRGAAAAVQGRVRVGMRKGEQREPGPRHDPLAEEAIVFRKPDEHHQRVHNSKKSVLAVERFTYPTLSMLSSA